MAPQDGVNRTTCPASPVCGVNGTDFEKWFMFIFSKVLRMASII